MPNIYLYQNSAEPIRVVKEAFLKPTIADPNGEAIPVQFTVKGECSILEPDIELAFSPETTPIINANYAYIPEWRRYYYIKGPATLRAGLWELELKVDVLYSHATNISKIPCVCVRNRNVYNSYLIDDRVPLQNNYNVQYIAGTGSPLIPVSATGAGDYVYVATVIRGEAQQ